MVDFGNIVLNKWNVGTQYYWLSPSEYSTLSEDGVDVSGFKKNDDGNYYIVATQISESVLDDLYDYDFVHYWKCVNSTQGAHGA